MEVNTKRGGGGPLLLLMCGKIPRMSAGHYLKAVFCVEMEFEEHQILTANCLRYGTSAMDGKEKPREKTKKFKKISEN